MRNAKDIKNLGRIADARCSHCGIASGYKGDWFKTRPAGDANAYWKILCGDCVPREGEQK